MILDFAKKQVALIIAGSNTILPNYMMIGSGSGISISTMTTLINAADRQAVTSTDASTVYKATWIADWTSTEISGLTLTEMGMTYSGTGITGSMWSRTSMPALQCNGTQELRIQETFLIY
jgi:hypothetical protein